MEHPTPAPPALGRLDGLAYALFTPDEPASAGIVVIHGAGSSKESHFDFARVARANGMAALCFDARGHGESDGAFGPGVIDDVLAMCALMREHAPAVAIRGSSLGGFQALHAGARDPGVAAVVALCPATEDVLLRLMRSDEAERFRIDRPACEEWLRGSDVFGAVARLSPRTALLLMHAQGDERIPYTVSEELHAAAGEPKRLLVIPGGHHRSIQHDLELQNVAVGFVRRAVERAARG
ncbi:MAG TPA: alpha/beta fold hydrolase [Thermoleophilaceae bacterium]|nr:alpha/beta fold hydrolase [Thermoleophilaceae bacterium]